MAIPAPKHPGINAMLLNLFGVSRETHIRMDICTSCGEPATTFRDTLSAKEYTLSGLCQTCQNDVFDCQEED
jgi:hypothetical protein